MRCRIAIIFCTSLVLAQGTPPAKSRYRKQGTDALAREQSRSKADLCADAEKGGNALLAHCLVDQARETEKDYLAYIRAIGALLRLPSGAEPPAQNRIPFDMAEEAWQTYREKSCASMATQWEGGDQGPVAYSDCRLKLTWNHMNELADLYSDLWDGHATSAGGPQASVAEALAPVVAEVKSKSHIPLLLPSALSRPFAGAKHAAVESASDEEYAVSLYDDPDIGNAASLRRLRRALIRNIGPRNSPM